MSSSSKPSIFGPPGAPASSAPSSDSKDQSMFGSPPASNRDSKDLSIFGAPPTAAPASHAKELFGARPTSDPGSSSPPVSSAAPPSSASRDVDLPPSSGQDWASQAPAYPMIVNGTIHPQYFPQQYIQSTPQSQSYIHASPPPTSASDSSNFEVYHHPSDPYGPQSGYDQQGGNGYMFNGPFAVSTGAGEPQYNGAGGFTITPQGHIAVQRDLARGMSDETVAETPAVPPQKPIEVQPSRKRGAMGLWMPDLEDPSSKKKRVNMLWIAIVAVVVLGVVGGGVAAGLAMRAKSGNSNNSNDSTNGVTNGTTVVNGTTTSWIASSGTTTLVLTSGAKTSDRGSPTSNDPSSSTSVPPSSTPVTSGRRTITPPPVIPTSTTPRTIPTSSTSPPPSTTPITTTSTPQPPTSTTSPPPPITTTTTITPPPSSSTTEPPVTTVIPPPFTTSTPPPPTTPPPPSTVIISPRSSVPTISTVSSVVSPVTSITAPTTSSVPTLPATSPTTIVAGSILQKRDFAVQKDEAPLVELVAFAAQPPRRNKVSSTLRASGTSRMSTRVPTSTIKPHATTFHLKSGLTSLCAAKPDGEGAVRFDAPCPAQAFSIDKSGVWKAADGSYCLQLKRGVLSYIKGDKCSGGWEVSGSAVKQGSFCLEVVEAGKEASVGNCKSSKPGQKFLEV